MATEDQQTTERNESSEAAAPAGGPGFGLLFQAPEPAPAPRRSRAPRQGAEDEGSPSASQASDSAPSDSDSGDDHGAPRRRRGGRGRNKSDDAAKSDAQGEDSGGSEAGGADGGDAEAAEAKESRSGSKRGSRGGRSKKSGSGGDGQDEKDQSGKGSSGKGQSRGAKGGKAGSEDASAEDSEGQDAQSEDQGTDTEDAGDGGSGGSRRRRRRRRGSGGGGDSQDDPPGTVTKVREGRKDRDEPQAVKGSTRLEAKKQRRREGREAGRRRTVITEAEFLARRESVKRTMIVRSTGERTQIGVLEDDVLVEHYVSRETTSTMVGNVYLGRVQNVLPSMEAAFVDIGKGRNAVLYAGEVNWDAHGVGGGQARRIENALSSGDTVLVQVTKDPIGHKGARLTSQVSLPGRYLVYVPEGSMTGISRKLPDKERSRLKGILKQVVPDGAGVIVRTAAEGASEEELTKDVQRLTKTWESISSKAESKKGKKGAAPSLLHAEPDMTVRVIRDIFNEDFSEMVVSGDDAWREIRGYVTDVAPDLADRLEKWTGEKDIFAAHRIDEQIAKAMDRKVWLKSGGSLVIDRTEAMTVVDVNTGKFTGSGGNLEETVTSNNLEAAEEIVRQLRLRDIGGIIVIDFIDMVLEANRDLVIRRLLECLGRDRTKHQVAEVTSLGLVQMTRKRVGSGLIEVFSEQCESCNGRGIHVHSEPVSDGSAASSDDSGGGGRSKRGRGKGGAKGGGNGSSEESSEPREPKEPTIDKNGRTAAQIAAAAHAAAVKNIADDEVTEVTEVVEVADDDGADGGADASRLQPGGSRTSASEGESASASDGGDISASEEESDPASEEPKASPRRRGGRRAATSSGAPVSLQAVDLSAQSAPTESITSVAGEVSTAADAPPSPDAEDEAPAPRRKRKRVTSDAGPPTAASE
ncbi:hypothetical protein GCM10022199_23660 [Marihabitans asiaticum]|uniref:Ribonuclease E n=1 Tax=Marihabitans asiaticum TaxID=415218 RepID=A0A560W9V3_9MICO|nr:ribonuclease E/G [Marihabitans asiaticum]TWD14413.1 ribonuclease E [Marihabitans asiaticum]